MPFTYIISIFPRNFRRFKYYLSNFPATIELNNLTSLSVKIILAESKKIQLKAAWTIRKVSHIRILQEGL